MGSPLDNLEVGGLIWTPVICYSGIQMQGQDISWKLVTLRFYELRGNSTIVIEFSFAMIYDRQPLVNEAILNCHVY